VLEIKISVLLSMMKCLTSLSIKEVESKTMLRFQLTPVRMPVSRTQTATYVGEDVRKKEPSYTAGGNVNYYNHYGKQYGGS
jgi:hypothetical protein